MPTRPSRRLISPRGQPVPVVLRPQHGHPLHPVRRRGLKLDFPRSEAGGVVDPGPRRAQQGVVQRLIVTGSGLAVELVGGAVQAQRQGDGVAVGQHLGHVGAVSAQGAVPGALHTPASVAAVCEQAGIRWFLVHVDHLPVSGTPNPPEPILLERRRRFAQAG